MPHGVVDRVVLALKLASSKKILDSRYSRHVGGTRGYLYEKFATLGSIVRAQLSLIEPLKMVSTYNLLISSFLFSSRVKLYYVLIESFCSFYSCTGAFDMTESISGIRGGMAAGEE